MFSNFSFIYHAAVVHCLFQVLAQLLNKNFSTNVKQILRELESTELAEDYFAVASFKYSVLELCFVDQLVSFVT